MIPPVLWVGRWWVLPGEAADRVVVGSREVPLRFEGDDGVLWEFTLGADSIVWDHAAGHLAYATNDLRVTSEVREIMRALGGDGSLRIKPAPRDKSLLDLVSANLHSAPTLSGRKLRQSAVPLLGSLDHDRFRYLVDRLKPRHLVELGTAPHETFRPTLSGLIASSEGASATKVIEATLKVLRTKYAADADVSSYSLAEVAEAGGYGPSELVFVENVILIASLTSLVIQSSDGPAVPAIFGVPGDIEELSVGASLDDLWRVTRRGRLVERHWPTAPLHREHMVPAPAPITEVRKPASVRAAVSASMPTALGAAPSTTAKRDPSVEAVGGHVDLLLVVTTDVEHEALMRAARTLTGGEQPRAQMHRERRTYDDLGTIGGARVVVVQTEIGTATVGGSLATILTAIDEVRPTTIIMVGIAFGLDPDKQPIGHVLVSKQVHQYEMRRIGTGDDGRTEIVSRGDKATASPTVLSRLRASRIPPSEFGVDFGLLLSGEKLIDNSDYRQELSELEPEALGGEMEGGGLYVAAHDRQVRWCIVKAVCDYADGHKREGKKERQRTAADNAARYVLNAVAAGGFARRIASLTDTSSA